MSDTVNQQNTSEKEKRYLEVEVGSLKYCIPLSDISEVVPQFDISSVPLAPDYFRGLINLRGKILSIVDLSKKLNHKMTEIIPKQTCIVVFKIEDIEVGALVDRVLSVKSIPQSCIQFHGYKNKIKSQFITGVIQLNSSEESKESSEEKELRFLLDLEKLLDIDEIKRMLSQEAS